MSTEILPELQCACPLLCCWICPQGPLQSCEAIDVHMTCPVGHLRWSSCRVTPSMGVLDADMADARVVVVSHTANPEDPEVWMPPSRQSSATRARGASDDETFRQALRRPSSSEAGEPVDKNPETQPPVLEQFLGLYPGYEHGLLKNWLPGMYQCNHKFCKGGSWVKAAYVSHMLRIPMTGAGNASLKL